jgi:hypothetical protein
MERWREIQDVCDAALEHHETERGAFLNERCARPAQGRLGVAAGVRLNQRFQGVYQAGVCHRDRLATCARPPDPTRCQRDARLEFSNAFQNGLARQPARPMDERDAAVANGFRFARGHETARPLVQQGPHRSKFRRQLGNTDHSPAG